MHKDGYLNIYYNEKLKINIQDLGSDKNWK